MIEKRAVSIHGFSGGAWINDDPCQTALEICISTKGHKDQLGFDSIYFLAEASTQRDFL